jgi:hypothetical protein
VFHALKPIAPATRDQVLLSAASGLTVPRRGAFTGGMNFRHGLGLGLVWLLCGGCALWPWRGDRSKAAASPGSEAGAAAAPASVTPANVLTGKVARYNEAGRFVVLEFPVGRMPRLEQRLFVYRNGLKVGELKVTGPQREERIVADVVAGEAQAGDEVRDR